MNREILDHLLAALLVLLTLLAVRHFGLWTAVALGLVIGLAILGNVRLEAIPLLVGAVLLWKHRRRALVPLAVMLAAAALVVLPWVGRNAASVGCWTVTTDSKALWKANNVRTLETLRGGGWIDHVPQPRSFPPTPQDAYEHWQRTGVVVPYDECAQMSTYQRKVLDFWRDHPGEKARLALFDATWLWQPSVVETRGRPGAGGWLDTLRRSAEPAYMIVLYALAIVGVFLVPRIVAIVAVSLLAYQTLTAMLFVGETRYRVPWDFLLALCACACVVWLWERRPLWQRGPVVE
jgi:hypothetical protein